MGKAELVGYECAVVCFNSLLVKTAQITKRRACKLRNHYQLSQHKRRENRARIFALGLNQSLATLFP